MQEILCNVLCSVIILYELSYVQGIPHPFRSDLDENSSSLTIIGTYYQVDRAQLYCNAFGTANRTSLETQAIHLTLSTLPSNRVCLACIHPTLGLSNFRWPGSITAKHSGTMIWIKKLMQFPWIIERSNSYSNSAGALVGPSPLLNENPDDKSSNTFPIVSMISGDHSLEHALSVTDLSNSKNRCKWSYGMNHESTSPPERTTNQEATSLGLILQLWMNGESPSPLM